MIEKWYLPETDCSDWKEIKLPCFWEDAGIGLDDFDGAVWFRTIFDLPVDFKDSTYHIFLDYVKDYNIAWVNGHKIGETFGDKNWSDYYVSSKYLKPKNNVLTVRVFNVDGKGGLNYHPLWESNILAGKWVCKADYKIDAKTFPKPKIVNVNPFSHPTVIYNAMICPLTKLPITGFIWYQGESNAGRGYEYRYLFPAMITDWRTRFAQGDLPFYFVQPANFGHPEKTPGESDWAELRESQTYALDLSCTGMAVAIDIGEENDIHPKNKQEVGRRLALQALKKTYGKNLECDPPMFENVVFDKNKAIVTVRSESPIGKRMENVSIPGFELAGKDGVFYFADKVEIDGMTLIVVSSRVSEPAYVRYAWAKNPGISNVFNAAGLPLVPFRTDTLKGITTDRVFDLNIVYF
jgi:sialate O-acetylesterase